MEYRHKSAPVDEGIALFRVYSGEIALSHREVHRLWRDDPAFVHFYTQLLTHPGYPGFCWETPPVTTQTLDRDHEFVVVRSDSHVSLTQNWTPFAEHFCEGQLAASFLNLGKNGRMIAPSPDPSFDGASISTFLTTASADRIFALWAKTGEDISKDINHRPVWLSTAGLGVSWLHIRIDSRPKYYRYAPYKNPS